MSTSSAEALLNQFEADESFAQRVKEAETPEAAYGLVKSNGFEVTRQELKDAVLDRYGDRLSPEQVEAVSGGDFWSDFGDGFAVGVTIIVAAPIWVMDGCPDDHL